jgi:6-pyruvoyltetrahydropterin/6-carboxytetrahydropterin synthase
MEGSMITCTRRLQFCAGHRVVGHESKCRHLHGHNYVALLTAEAPRLDDIGRVIDFGVLKDKYGTWIEEHWDHRMLLWVDDPIRVQPGAHSPGIVRVPFNPTAENMAHHLLHLSLLMHTPVRLVKVTLWETENCYAEATR